MVRLRRKNSRLLAGIMFVLLAVCLLGPARSGAIRLVIGGGSALVGLLLIGYAVRPFRFVIGPEGLDLRSGGVHRLVRWDEIDELVLDTPPQGSTPAGPRLVLVPATGVALGVPVSVEAGKSGREGRVVLELDEVRQPREEVARALAQFGGHRFVDATAGRQAAPDFTVVLRGYDVDAVDRLIHAGQAALMGQDAARAALAGAEIAAFRASPLVTLRGYDREQVDAFLAGLLAQLQPAA
jgi:DivIVA domain-containing protein